MPKSCASASDDILKPTKQSYFNIPQQPANYARKWFPLKVKSTACFATAWGRRYYHLWPKCKQNTPPSIVGILPSCTPWGRKMVDGNYWFSYMVENQSFQQVVKNLLHLYRDRISRPYPSLWVLYKSEISTYSKWFAEILHANCVLWIFVLWKHSPPAKKKFLPYLILKLFCVIIKIQKNPKRQQMRWRKFYCIFSSPVEKTLKILVYLISSLQRYDLKGMTGNLWF